MPEPSLQAGSSRRVAVRAAGALVALVAFLCVASLIDPDQSTARPGRAGSESTSADSARSLGSLEGGKYRVSIVASEWGPLYTVTDAATGRVLIRDASADEVYKAVPDLDLPNAVAAPLGEVEIDPDM